VILSRYLQNLLTIAALVALVQSGNRSTMGDRVMSLTRDTRWTLVRSIRIGFNTFHPQGLVKIGDTFFVSSVEVTTPTRRFAKTVDGFDRDTGAGVGHLFKIDKAGALVADLKLGEGPIYHPGGIDYDGKRIWVPVAEYRPNSRSIVYSVDPDQMKATEVLRFADHLGAVAVDVDRHTLHAASWGSRRFYRWPLDATGRVAKLTPINTLNPSHYVDYQDCKYAGRHRMLCTGVTEIRRTLDNPPFRLGGLDLVDLNDGRPLHQVPILLWTAAGMSMTQNPSWFDETSTGLRGYFMPDDTESTIYIYEIDTR
jgi:hypothetical protein